MSESESKIPGNEKFEWPELRCNQQGGVNLTCNLADTLIMFMPDNITRLKHSLSQILQSEINAAVNELTRDIRDNYVINLTCPPALEILESKYSSQQKIDELKEHLDELQPFADRIHALEALDKTRIEIEQIGESLLLDQNQIIPSLMMRYDTFHSKATKLKTALMGLDYYCKRMPEYDTGSDEVNKKYWGKDANMDALTKTSAALASVCNYIDKLLETDYLLFKQRQPGEDKSR